MRTTSRTVGLWAVFAMVTVAAQTQPPQAPKPGPEDKKLDYFVGKWTHTGEMKPGPMGPGGKASWTETCEWFEGRFAIVCRSDGKGPMGPMKGLGIMSYSPEEKVYTYVGTDSGGMTMTTVPGSRPLTRWELSLPSGIARTVIDSVRPERAGELTE